MRYDPEKHHRRSIRLKGYDYSRPGAYFVTVCTQDRACLFGEVVGGAMRLNPFGEIVTWTWYDLPNHVPNVALDAFVVMPNHVHGIVVITDSPTITHCLKSFANSKRFRRDGSTNNVAHPARPSGNATITNTSSAMRNKYNKYIVDKPQRSAFDREKSGLKT